LEDWSIATNGRVREVNILDYYRIPQFRKALLSDISSEDDAVRLITELMRTIFTEPGNQQAVTVEITLKFTLKA
jgi:hypothetical protein